ncbi:MAG: amidohydrolase [Armatimonadetes bacterium]|nr:amidohydrolase [Armatimonadota bacterium]
MATLEIRGATLLTMAEDAEPTPDGLIAVDDGLITYAGASAGYVRRSEPDEILEAGGCVALPGLVNAHTHCAMTLLRGFADDMDLKPWLEEMVWPTEMKLTEEDVYWGVMLGSVEMLRAGVTCFNDMYHHAEAGTRAAIDAGIRACPSGVLLGFLPTAEAMLARALEFTAGLAKQAHPRIHPMLGPHAPYTCPDHLLRRVVEGAAAQGIAIHIHVAETKHEVDESIAEHGCTPVERLDRLGLFEVPVNAAHCVWLSDQDIELLAERRVGVVHCPGSNMKLASGVCPVPKLLARGVIVGLGTDGAASNNNLDLLEEARLAALVHKLHDLDPKVLNAPQALALATRGSAQALGLGGMIGTLEVGKRADVAIVDLSAPHLAPGHHVVSDLVYAARASDVVHTVVDGVVVMRDRKMTHVDEEEIIREVRERGRRLAGP